MKYVRSYVKELLFSIQFKIVTNYIEISYIIPQIISLYYY